MAFGGFFDDVKSGGDFYPYVKYDAKSGRISRADKVNGEKSEVDITKNFKAIFDFENVEIGWSIFPLGAAPDFKMRKMSEGVNIPKPGEGYKRAVRWIIKLSKDCGGDVREFSSNAIAFMDGAKKLCDDYDQGVKQNPGKLPVVKFVDSVATPSKGGALKVTNYAPVFEITDWVPRPVDLIYKSRSSSESSAPASTGPASTGSTKVAAPSDEDDFG